MGSTCCPQHPSLAVPEQSISLVSQQKQEEIHHKTEENVPVTLQVQSIMTDPQNTKAEPIEGYIDLPDGSKYEGFLKNGIPHGRGMQIHENGDKYMGSFVQGIKDGQGRYEYSNGTIYVGEFKQGTISGKGRMEWPNGDWYQGSFKNNIINGYGKYYSRQNNSYYEGTYLNGKRHGKGKITSEGNELDGYWEHGEFRFKKTIHYDSS